MTTTALPMAILMQPGDHIPGTAAAVWPRSIPSRDQARRTLFKGATLPPEFEAPSVKFLSSLSVATRELLGTEVNSPTVAAWNDALATLWRVEIALAMPDPTEYDEEALTMLLDEIAAARDALVVSNPYGGALAAAIVETHRALLPAWVSLMRRAAQSTPREAKKKPAAAVKVSAHTIVAMPSRKKQLLTGGAVLSLASGAVWILMQL